MVSLKLEFVRDVQNNLRKKMMQEDEVRFKLLKMQQNLFK